MRISVNRGVHLLKIIDLFIVVYVLNNIIYANYTFKTNRNVALLALYLSVTLLFRTRKSIILFLSSIMIFYFNYSVIMKEYIGFYKNVQSFMIYHTIYYYGITINMFVLFLIIFSRGMSIQKKIEVEFINRRYNSLILIIIFVVLMLIWFFAIDRQLSDTYGVKITSIYEYAYLLFIFAFYYSKDSKICNNLFIILAGVFVVQDLYLGGRITSLQIILVVFYMNYKRLHLRRRELLYGISGGILLFNFVDVYRVSYSASGITIGTLIKGILDSRFTLNTAYNAYYTTVTHVVAHSSTVFDERLNNFYGFLCDLIGIELNNYRYLSLYVRDLGLANIGGGWYMSHFYFWFGWIGVIGGSLLLVFIVNHIMRAIKCRKKDLYMLQLITILSTLPRWYLYTPLSFYRGIILVTVLYLLFEKGLKRNG